MLMKAIRAAVSLASITNKNKVEKGYKKKLLQMSKTSGNSGAASCKSVKNLEDNGDVRDTKWMPR